MTPEKLKQRRCDRIRRAREKAAAEATAKWVKENFGPYADRGSMLGPSLSPFAVLSSVIAGIALAAGIAMLIEHGFI